MNLITYSNVSMVNVVGGGKLGVQVDLLQLFNDLKFKELEYEPETSYMLKFKMDKNSPTIMLFSTGSYFLAGAKSIKHANEAYHNMISELKKLGVEVNNQYFEIRNIVCKLEFRREFELSELSIDLGIGHCEYEPEELHGVLCRFPDCKGVFQIYRTGVVLSTGTKNMKELSEDVNSLIARFKEININVSLEK